MRASTNLFILRLVSLSYTPIAIPSTMVWGMLGLFDLTVLLHYLTQQIHLKIGCGITQVVQIFPERVWAHEGNPGSWKAQGLFLQPWLTIWPCGKGFPANLPWRTSKLAHTILSPLEREFNQVAPQLRISISHWIGRVSYPKTKKSKVVHSKEGTSCLTDLRR